MYRIRALPTVGGLEFSFVFGSYAPGKRHENRGHGSRDRCCRALGNLRFATAERELETAHGVHDAGKEPSLGFMICVAHGPSVPSSDCQTNKAIPIRSCVLRKHSEAMSPALLLRLAIAGCWFRENGGCGLHSSSLHPRREGVD